MDELMYGFIKETLMDQWMNEIALFRDGQLSKV